MNSTRQRKINEIKDEEKMILLEHSYSESEMTWEPGMKCLQKHAAEILIYHYFDFLIHQKKSDHYKCQTYHLPQDRLY